jgi:RHS repeat-associated protein
VSSGRVTVGHPVDVGSGAVFTLSTDVVIPGSLELRWRRHYSTAATGDMWLGPRWTVPYFMTLERRSEGYVLSGAHGEEVTFAGPEGPLRPGSVLLNLGANMELRRDDRQFVALHWHNHGDVSRFCFPASGEGRLPLACIENLAGHRVRVEYDTAGRPIRLVQELERRTIELRYARGDLISEIHFSGKNGRRLLVRYEYDRDRRLVTAVDAMGGHKGYRYDRHGLLIEETNPLGSRFVFQYDHLDRCIHTMAADGFLERRLQYLTTPRMTRVTDSYGGVTEYLLNESGQVLQIVNPMGAVTTNTFDDHGRLVGVTHPDGAQESQAYDSKGNPSASVDPSGAQATLAYNDLHVPTLLVDRNGHTWKLPDRYQGSLWDVDDLPRRSWDYSWDRRRLVSQARSPGDWVFQIRRDESFSWQERVDQISLVRRTEYDELGFPAQVLDAQGEVSRTRRDELGRPVEVTSGGSDVTRYRWNGIGRMTQRLGPGDRCDTWEYDEYGHLIAQTNSLGATSRFEYDSEGRLTAIINRVGERLTYRRDLLGRVVEEKLFDGRVQRYEYDQAGRQIGIELSDGRTVTQRFDANGRLVARQSSDGLLEEFAHDREGRVVRAANDVATLELKRDRFGRILSEVQNGRRVRYRYDADGNRVGRSLPVSGAGRTLERVFDARGRLVAIHDERGLCQELRWDTVDRLVERRCPGGLRELFIYDDRRRLREHRIEARDGHLIRVHTYDPNGNLVGLEDNRRGTSRYTYDRLNRLREVRRGGTPIEAYEYDDNQTVRATHRGTRRCGPGGRVLHDGARELSYGDDGALAVIDSDQAAWRLRHDVNGRLVEVVRPGAPGIGYEYDPFGRRTAKILGADRTEFLWEGWALAAELRDAEVVDVYLCVDLRPLAQWRAGRRLTPILHCRGAVQEVFDEAGRLSWSCDLDAYGNLRSQQGSPANPFRLRGQYHDAETGLHYNFHRHFDPRLCDFTAPDPIGVAGGHNLYAYPRNPLRWDDPFGLECGDPDQHPPEEESDPNKPAKGPSALSDPPEEPPPGSPLSKDEAFDKAAAVRDAKLEELDGLSGKQRNKVSTVVGACDPETGETGLGVKVTGQDRDMCAEDLARADLASKTDTDPSKFVYSPAVRPRTDETVPVCTRCQDRGVTPEQLPPGTPFEPRPEPAATQPSEPPASSSAPPARSNDTPGEE